MEALKNHKEKNIIEKYKNSILKDNDFKDLKLRLILKKEEINDIIKRIQQDAQFLELYNLTDYSLLLSIHSFSKEEYEKSKDNPRIFKSLDDKYMFCLSIIDFLCVKNFYF